MAGGWSSHDENVSTDQEWRWAYPRYVRALCEALQSGMPLSPSYILVAAETASRDRVQRILDEIDTTFCDSANVVIVSKSSVSLSPCKATFSMSLAEFAAAARSLYGASVDSREVLLPGKTGLVSLSIEELRHLEGDLEILHSRIADQTKPAAKNDQFWRGNQPRWQDFLDGEVLERDIRPALQKAIEDAAEVNKTQTITLYHSPGAGGTTLALRLAWDNRNSLPVLVLRRYSEYTADRLDWLYQRTAKHILLIADGSVLSEPDREQLFRDLASRHTRVIILHVQRTMSKNPHEFSLPDPMPQSEARRFAAAFVPRAPEYNRQQDLRRIASSDDPRWLVYRLPFFFGLIAFDDQYLGVEHYTTECLRFATYNIKKALKFLGIVTNYSQSGIDEACILRILQSRIEPSSDLNSVWGEGPARLVVRQDGTLKVIHPTVARQILRALIGGHDWQAGLKDACIELIQTMRRLLGGDPATTKSYMESLFVRRYELGESEPGQSSVRSFFARDSRDRPAGKP